jgi:hypothetical protein
MGRRHESQHTLQMNLWRSSCDSSVVMRPPSAHPSPLEIIPHFPQQDARQTFGAAVRANPGLLNAPFLVADPHCAHTPTSIGVRNVKYSPLNHLPPSVLIRIGNGPAILTLAVTITSIHLNLSRLSSGPSAGANHGANRIIGSHRALRLLWRKCIRRIRPRGAAKGASVTQGSPLVGYLGSRLTAISAKNP